MRKKCSPKNLEIQGNVLRAVAIQELHVADAAHELRPENASFEDLLLLRYALEAQIAKKRGHRQLPDPSFRMERRAAKPALDERYDELSLTTVRTESHRRTLRSRLQIQ